MAIFIAVIFVMVIMVAFLVASIARIKDQIESQIKRDVDRSLKVYDPIIEKKSEKLHEIELAILEKQLEWQEMEISEPSIEYDSYQTGTVINDFATYINRDFFKDYAKVKNEFQEIAFRAMEETVNELIRVKRDVNVHEFKELLDIFDYELQYQMTTLSSNSQLEVMQLVMDHSMGKRRILQKYISEHEEFNFKNFMDYVRDYIFDHDSTIYVLFNSNKEMMKEPAKNVVFQIDSTIGEGYIIKFRNKIYNYSL